MLPPEFIGKLPFSLRSNLLPWFSSFSKVFQDGLRLLLHFLHKGSHDHSSTLYFLHENLKFIKLLEKRIGTSILPAPLPSTYSIGLLDGFPYYRAKEFIRFSIYSTRARILSSYVASTASNLESGDSTVVLLLNFCGILQQKWVPLGVLKICLIDFLVEFTRTYKKQGNW